MVRAVVAFAVNEATVVFHAHSHRRGQDELPVVDSQVP